MQRIDRGERVTPRRTRAAGKMIELELVRRHDIGRRHRVLAHEIGYSRPHEHVAPDIPDHRIAAIARLRICRPHARDRSEGRRAGKEWRSRWAPSREKT